MAQLTALHPAKASKGEARPPHTATTARPQRRGAFELTARSIQRMDPIRGFPGFFTGSLPEENRGGTFNTVWSQVEPTQVGSSTMSHSSVKLSKGAKGHLVGFADMSHFADEENTHAEDRLFAYVHQLVAEKGAKPPESIVLPEFFVSASPCSSTFETSAKTVGCTENLIRWATHGMQFNSEGGCVITVKLKIAKLIVNKLYKSNSYEGATASMQALIKLKKEGAIGGWEIETDTHLDTSRIKGYAKVG